MFREPGSGGSSNFGRAVLPWMLGAGGLLVYLITLNPWVSLLGLGPVVWASGWSWQPELAHPLTCIVLWPFRCLPDSWIPLALNLLNAVCAGAVLAVLARSVALLPHDVAPEQPFRPAPAPARLPNARGDAAAGAITFVPPRGTSASAEATADKAADRAAGRLLTHHAWAPPVLAVVVCALQLSFWEHATAFTGEMIDLLVFAGVIWCLLEFRISQDERWLWGCALLYGAGMANNWAMIGFLPLFVAALFRVKGGSFFSVRFLARAGLWGLAGLSLYLLLPALHGLLGHPHLDFWPALKANLKSQKGALSALRRPALRVLALASLLPLGVLSIRWTSHTVQFGDDTRLGVFLTKATGHFVHALFLVSSLWMALDPAFSPRHLGAGLATLTYYYISAIVTGYCAGYFLLFASPGKPRPVARAALSGVYVLLVAMPLALAVRNLGQVRVTNGHVVRGLARLLYADLPAGKSVIFSDDPTQLFLLRTELAAHGRDKDALLLDMRSLPSVQYQIFMAERFKPRWPMATPTNRFAFVGPAKVLELVSAFAAREPAAYLHPCFDAVFERFTDRPAGALHYLEPGRQAESLSNAQAAANEQLWENRWRESLQGLAEVTKEKPLDGSSWRGSILSALLLGTEKNFTATVVAAAYSKCLNDWGVKSQRLGRWNEAGVWFGRAVALNPENLAAQVNAEYNERWQHGDKGRVDAAAAQQRYAELFGKYHNWADILNSDGPIDEPTFLFEAGKVLLASSNDLQAAREFARCAELATNWLTPKLWQALCDIDARDFASALELARDIPPAGLPQDGTELSQLLFCRTTALQGLGRTNEAAACLEEFVGQHQQQGAVLASAAELFERNRQFKKELVVLDALLRREPNNPRLLANQGWAELQLSQYEAAIATLARALELAPADENVRLHHAMACLRAGQLEAARNDYQQLLKTAKHSRTALFGLGAVAWRQHDTNAAIDLYEQYLSNGIPESAQYRVATERLRQLQAR